MIRVAANLAWLVPGRVGGSEEYTIRLLSAVIAAAPADIDLRVIGAPALFAAHPGLRAAECVTLRGPQTMRPWRIASESTIVHRATRDADVVHHFGGRVPARNHGNDIVTIHDLQPLQMPENFSAVKRHYLGFVLPRSVRAARMVLTPSEWVASTVVELLGADPADVRPVSSTWDAADHIEANAAEVDGLGDGAVVLYPAVTHPHKRHELLLAAMERLAGLDDDVTLVLTGGTGRAEAAVQAAIERSPVRVVRPGRVSAARLRGLYRQADVLAFPSAYEGFGLPVLEAMRAGVPVVASNATALPEVIGDTGLLVDGADPDRWAEAIVASLHGGADVEARVARARARAEHWSPKAAAERLIDAWRAVS
ncbi:MAG: glycosyltransferase family 1 protein [Acidimicrobiales bacterium]